MRRLVVALAACACVAAGIALVRGEVPCAVLATQPTCEVALRPGPSEDAAALVEVTGARSYPPSGELRLTTVAVDDDLELGSWLRARVSSNVDAVPRERIYPSGIDEGEALEMNAALMADSQLVATIAALSELGYELEGEGAKVAAVADDATTDELAEGDVIVAVDGVVVRDSGDVVAAVRAGDPGDEVSLELAEGDGSRTIDVTLGTSPYEPGTPYVGVLLTTVLDLPVEVSIDAGVIGGPSAGLMFALSIVELLDEPDLTGGHVIAGTGTLERDGTVGAVGGVRQKVAGAASAEGRPAGVFLVPEGNLAEARSAAVERDVLLVPVGTLDEALAALQQLRTGQHPHDAALLAASS